MIAKTCPPCSGRCNQGRNCPALPEWPARRAVFVTSQQSTPASKPAPRVDLEHEPRAMPVTFEGDEPSSWEYIGAGARWCVLALGLLIALSMAAGFYFNR